MTKQKQVYKCNVCGNVVEVLHTGVGELVCCNEPMELMTAKDREEGTEKHLPVKEELPAESCAVRDGFKIKIGEDEHPMEEGHYIEWIEINTVEGRSGKKFLQPGDKPEVDFHTRKEVASARAYCNVHGLWEMKWN